MRPRRSDASTKSAARRSPDPAVVRSAAFVTPMPVAEQLPLLGRRDLVRREARCVEEPPEVVARVREVGGDRRGYPPGVDADEDDPEAGRQDVGDGGLGLIGHRAGRVPRPRGATASRPGPGGYDPREMPHVMTVRGPVDPSTLGFTLPHEHTQCTLWQIPARWDYWELTADEPVILEELGVVPGGRRDRAGRPDAAGHRPRPPLAAPHQRAERAAHRHGRRLVPHRLLPAGGAHRPALR